MKILPRMGKSSSSGQALILVVVVLAVALVAVLSVVSQTVTEVGVTTQEEDSLRAFNEAEAGVEYALFDPVIGTSGQVNLGPQIQPNVDVSLALPSNGRDFVHPLRIGLGESLTFWLVSHDTTGLYFSCNPDCYTGDSFDICWGELGSNVAAEVSLYYDENLTGLGANPNFSGMRVATQVYDPDDTRNENSTGGGNQFLETNIADGSCSISGQTFGYGASINWNSVLTPLPCNGNDGCIVMATVKLFYNATPQPVGISLALSGLPAQGIVIDSTGEQGGATRKINVYQAYPEAPFVFQSALFSGTNIIHF